MLFSDHTDDNYFFSQPHQPFFILAFVNAIFTMLIFMLSYKGILNIAINRCSFSCLWFNLPGFYPCIFSLFIYHFPTFCFHSKLRKESLYASLFSLLSGFCTFWFRYHCKSHIFCSWDVFTFCRTLVWIIHTK